MRCHGILSLNNLSTSGGWVPRMMGLKVGDCTLALHCTALHCTALLRSRMIAQPLIARPLIGWHQTKPLTPRGLGSQWFHTFKKSILTTYTSGCWSIQSCSHQLKKLRISTMRFCCDGQIPPNRAILAVPIARPSQASNSMSQLSWC
jgi:hypothetical protein